MPPAATPRQLAARSILGSWLLFSIAPLLFLVIRLFGSVRNESGWPLVLGLLWRLAPIVAIAVSGIILMRSNEKRLRIGLNDDRWPEPLLVEARDWLNRPAIRFALVAFAIVLLAVAVFVLLDSPHGSRGFAAFTYIFMVPSLTYARIKALLTPPAPHKPLLDWTTLQPLHSAHWGEQRRFKE